ncbi:MAG: beta-N-acetylhexosaminidase [Candidatus Hydrogenedentes bacterium]|nr:beta-N-acetylhexosaminidase [Candidatus Hydrogenedentota bacterium]
MVRSDSRALMVAAVAACAMAAAGAAELLPVVPQPRHVQAVESPGDFFDFTQVKEVLLPAQIEDAAGGIEQLNARLSGLGIDALGVRAAGPPTALLLGVEPAPELEERVAALPAPHAEGYRLRIDAEGIVVLGHDHAGLYYGLVTLAQLVDAQGRVPALAISDWPDQRLRGTYLAGKGDWQRRILEFAALKLNLVLFEDTSLYRMDDAAVREEWERVFAFCRRHFIEPVPELQSLGWGQHVLAYEPAAVEGVSVSQVPFDVSGGAIAAPEPVAAPPPGLANAGFEEGEGASPAGWVAEGPGVLSHVDGDVVHSGSRSIRLHADRKAMIRAWQDVACLPHQSYEVQAWIKTDKVSPGHAYIEAYGLRSNGELGRLLTRPVHVSGTSDWRYTAHTIDTHLYKRLRIYIRIQDASGTAWFDDVAVVGVKPRHPLENVIVTDAAPVIVQSADAATTYEPGRDFRVEPAPLRYPFASGEPARITLTDNSRLANGDKVLLSYTYAPRDGITCCPSEPLYQEYMRRSVHDVIRCLQPRYLHIGHDEPRVLNRDTRCTRRGLSNSEIFVDDIKRMREYAREADPEVRLMMWDDAVNPYQNAPHFGMQDAARLIPRDVIICIWWYSDRDVENQIEKSTQYFLDLGFDVTGSPWFEPQNAYTWAETMHRHGEKTKQVLGDLYTSWGHPTRDPWGALAVTAEHGWTFDLPAFELR